MTRITEFYTALVQTMLADQDGFWHATRTVFDTRLQGKLDGKRVLDVGCGEGHLGRHLLQFGPDRVIGVDISTVLLEQARLRAEAYGPTLHYQHDDAQVLASIETGSIDAAVSNLAIMDIPDHRRLFAAVRRVLRPGGLFLFSMMHPCFEAPFGAEGQFLMDPGEPERRTAYTIRRYATEGRWYAGKEGMRSRVGAHHRTVSTVLCDLLGARFTLTHLNEPVTKSGDLGGEVPRTLVIEVCA